MIKVFKKKEKRTGNLNMNEVISCKAQRMSNTRPSYHFKMIKNSPKQDTSTQIIWLIYAHSDIITVLTASLC